MQRKESYSTIAGYQECSQVTTLVNLLKLRSAQHPQKIAYTYLVNGEDEEVSLTYGELDQQARAIGKRLERQGLRGQRALLLYMPGLDFIAGFFGCLYAGLVAVPAYPPDPDRLKRTLTRLEVIAADAEARVALTTQAVLSKAAKIFLQAPILKSLEWVASDAVESEIGEPSTVLDSSAGDEIAFLQYTSGSTGNPRGVMLTHSNLLHNASMVRSAFEHSRDDKYVSWLPTFHDMGFMVGVLQPLYSGIPAVLIPPGEFLRRPLVWLNAISRHKATTSGGPNFSYDLCVRKITDKDRARLDLSGWTVAFNGAEPIRKETLERFAKAFKPCGFRREALYPCYGLAEATLLVAGVRKSELPIAASFSAASLEKGLVARQASGEQDQHFLVSCGQTSQDQEIVIVDPQTNKRCPPAEIGEIWVRGPSIGQGYWNKPAETEQTFRAYIADTGEGPFLRTGDLGLIDDQGLFVNGRLKDLIIIRGLNHYPQDIEFTAEKSHPALRAGCGAAFSVAMDGEEKLVVVYEVDDRKQPDPVEITDAIRRSISEYHELQTHSVVLIKPRSIPKTSSGKIQRTACRREFLRGSLEEIHRSTLENNSGSPRTESFVRRALLAIDYRMRLPVIESYVMEQAAAVLRLPSSRLHSDQPLSALGLDSLMAIELKNQIEDQLGTPVPASKLLSGITVRQVALLVQDQLESAPEGLTALSRSGEELQTEYPLSYTQKALWFFYQLSPESAAYNVNAALRISSHIDAGALTSAFQSLIDRHACLRTTFAANNGQPVQKVQSRHQARLREVPASELSWDDLYRAMAEEAHAAFDLEAGPVYRATLFTRSPEEHILLLAVHHIVIDGWSFWVLLDELIALYEAELSGGRTTLSAPALDYSDYVRWQAELLEGQDGERLFQYWKQELSGDLPFLNLPTSRVRPPVRTYSGASYGFKLHKDIVKQFREVVASGEATLYMGLLAVFQVLLHRYTGQDDILVGSPISSRSRTEFERIVGCFFNAIVLRADFSSGMTFEEFLGQVREKVLGALDHQDYPSHLLAERLQPVRDPSRPPLFQATFILQKPTGKDRSPISFEETLSPTQNGGLALSFIPIDKYHSRMELELEMIESDGSIYAWLHYNRDLFDAALIERMADHYRVLLEGVVAKPKQRVSNLPLLTPEEVQDLLPGESPYPGSSNRDQVKELFLEQARKTPEKVAVVYKDSSITFNELSERSTQLASLIRRLRR
jgi:acyl-CoA synthetase (AMP-forming)/AMP-acid ligase II/acyl carrier protein